MNREELYGKILGEIIKDYADVISGHKDVADEFELNGVRSTLSLAKEDEGLNKSNFRNLINSMYIRSNLEEVSDDAEFLISIKSYENINNKRNFIWHSQDLSVINCKQFFQDDPNYTDIIMLIIERICYNDHNRTQFLKYLKTNEDSGVNDYCIIYDPTKYPANNEWKLYMYGLCSYLNNGDELSFDDALNYHQLGYNLTFSYKNEVQYNQYIDIYDVISEWNHCSDILSAFLKMYQILEYIVYRKGLVAIIQGANIKQSFVRQVKGLDRRFANNERETFKNGLKDIFPSFSGKIISITPDMEDFCKKYYPLTNGGTTYLTQANINDPVQVDSCISRFIYDTRCAIVHNKESEFHITTINYSEYAAIIPLMKNILDVVGERLLDLINDVNNKIVFSVPVLKLY